MATESQSSNETFIFKCNQHAANISEKLLGFYEENEFFDTVLVAGSERLVVEAHRIVMSASSDYFLQLFRTNSTASNVHQTELKDIDSSTFKSVIDFMYSGCIELRLDIVESVLRTAVFLKMKTLVDGCRVFIEEHITFSNCLNWLRLAKEFNLSELKEKSSNFVYTYFEKVSKENEMLLLDEMELKDLFFNDNPHGDFEEHVFLAMVDWIKYDKPNREPLTLQLLSMVRYQYLTPKFIVENRKHVCKTVESYELICGWLQWHLSPETRSLEQQNCTLKPRKPGLLTAMSCADSQNIIKIQTFDKNIEAWSITKQIPLWKKKEYFSMTVIKQKLIVVAGQINGAATNTIECLDLHTLQWTQLPSMGKSRYRSCLAYLNENLFVFGGRDSNTKLLNSLEMYNFTTKMWQDLQPLNELSKFSQIVAHNGILYIVDFPNGLLQSFNPSSNKWSSKVFKKEELRDFGIAAIDGFLYIIGGCNTTTNQRVNTVKRYNIANGCWSEMARLPTENCYMKTVVFGNKILVCGGDLKLNLVNEYNLNTNTWSTLKSALIDYAKFDNLICILPEDLF